MSQIGNHMLPCIPDKPARRKIVKGLFNSLEMGVSYESWRREHSVPDIRTTSDLRISLPNGTLFDIKEYMQTLTKGNETLEGIWGDAIDSSRLWRSFWNPAGADPAASFLSFLRQELEARTSMKAKMAMLRECEKQGTKILNLQHDGIVVATGSEIGSAELRLALQCACSRATGYHQPVEIKTIEIPGRETPSLP